VGSTITNNIFLRFFSKKHTNKANDKNNINKIYNKNFEKFEGLQKELLITRLII
jgi:hypothetical protein